MTLANDMLTYICDVSPRKGRGQVEGAGLMLQLVHTQMHGYEHGNLLKTYAFLGSYLYFDTSCMSVALLNFPSLFTPIPFEYGGFAHYY